MPSRVIRGEINSSRSLERVSMLADLTFRALLVAVDDFGRFDGRLHVLRAALFPTRTEVTDAKLDKWLDELEAEGCIRRYAVSGSPYIMLPNWEKHLPKSRRAAKSRFPEPPGISEDFLGNPRKSEEIPAPSVLRLANASSDMREGESEGEPEPAPSAPTGLRPASVRDAWERMKETGVSYRPSASRWSLTSAREKSLRAAMKEHAEHGLEVGSLIVHGYRKLHADWEGLEQHFSPDTLLRASHRAKYLEAGLSRVTRSPVNGASALEDFEDTESIMRRLDELAAQEAMKREH